MLQYEYFSSLQAATSHFSKHFAGTFFSLNLMLHLQQARAQEGKNYSVYQTFSTVSWTAHGPFPVSAAIFLLFTLQLSPSSPTDFPLFPSVKTFT
jgi:hypothetical protein